MQKNKVINPNYIYIVYLITNIAAAMTWPVTTIYLTKYLHRSFTESGLILMAASLIAMLASFLAGRLFDFWKPYASLIISIFISLGAMIAMFFWHAWPVYPIFLLINNIGFGMMQTLLNSYVSFAGNKSPKKLFSNMAIFMNIGVVIGTFTGTFLFSHFLVRGTMIFGIIILLLMLILVLIGFNRNLHGSSTKNSDNHPLHLTKIMMALGFLSLMFYLTYQFWETVISPHMVKIGMSIEMYGWLWVFNGLTIILLQNFITNLTTKWSYVKSSVIGATIFAISFPPLIWANQFWQYILIFEILTIGEMMFTPSVNAWFSSLVQEKMRGRIMAFSAMSVSLGRSFGPVYAGFFIDNNLIVGLFASSFIILMISNLFVYFLGRSH
ncbi:MAG: MFS transporter [Lactobacillaceae bacterium]|jgi:MFS family permease|nr:MFS transporter [Lactobacillaceae bacterium]